MPTTYTIGPDFDRFVQAQLATGRYATASDVLHEALRLLESRERLQAALDVSLDRAWADAQAGRVKDADNVFDRLEAKYGRMAQGRREP